MSQVPRPDGVRLGEVGVEFQRALGARQAVAFSLAEPEEHPCLGQAHQGPGMSV